VWGWGDNLAGTLGFPTVSDEDACIPEPRIIPMFRDVGAQLHHVACGPDFSFAWSRSEAETADAEDEDAAPRLVFGWGMNEQQQLGVVSLTGQPWEALPRLLDVDVGAGLEDVTRVALGNRCGVAATARGELVGWGQQYGPTPVLLGALPAMAENGAETQASLRGVSVDGTGELVLAVDDRGRLYYRSNVQRLNKDKSGKTLGNMDFPGVVLTVHPGFMNSVTALVAKEMVSLPLATVLPPWV
jgi:alpha-tubulin suppressor-like RCC1 family protein